MSKSESSRLFEKNALEAAIKIGLLGMMIFWTIRIIQPFIVPVIWGVIIAVAVEPFIVKLCRFMGGRRKLAVGVFTFFVIAALMVPAVMLIFSSVDTVQSLVKTMNSGTLVIPPLPSQVEGWPVIGPSINKVWIIASSNLPSVLQQFRPQLKGAAVILLGSAKGGVAAFIMFVISIVIAAAMLVTAERGTAVINKIARRFAGDRGADITSLATLTIRGVMQGVVGVAIIQAVLAAIGMVVVNVPAAGLWTILVLICAVIQLPPFLVLGPVAAYVFSMTETTPAVLFLIWAFLVSSSDAFLKPLLMGRGIDIPMLVILIGALGGMLLSGIIGLFVGAVVLAIMYTLFIAWVDEKSVRERG